MQSRIMRQMIAAVAVIVLVFCAACRAPAIAGEEAQLSERLDSCEISEKPTGELPGAANTEAQIRLDRNLASTTSAEGGYELTASATFTLRPAKYEFLWTAAFEDPAADWAAGKAAEEYITMTTSGSHNEQATVVCTAAFGEPIVITVRVSYNGAVDETVEATCKCDYERRPVLQREGSKFYIGYGSVTLDNLYSMEIVGTVGAGVYHFSDIFYEIDLVDLNIATEDFTLPVTISSGYFTERVLTLNRQDIIMAIYHSNPSLLFDVDFDPFVTEWKAVIEIVCKADVTKDGVTCNEVIYTEEVRAQA